MAATSPELYARGLLQAFLVDVLTELLAEALRRADEAGQPLSAGQRNALLAASLAVLRDRT
jgi:hypothetical protein